MLFKLLVLVKLDLSMVFFFYIILFTMQHFWEFSILTTKTEFTQQRMHTVCLQVAIILKYEDIKSYKVLGFLKAIIHQNTS